MKHFNVLLLSALLFLLAVDPFATAHGRAPVDTLTQRELEVVRHLALGQSNREIGKALGISVEAVKEHVQKIPRKFDGTTRAQAAVWATKEGLV